MKKRDHYNHYIWEESDEKSCSGTLNNDEIHVEFVSISQTAVRSSWHPPCLACVFHVNGTIRVNLIIL